MLWPKMIFKKIQKTNSSKIFPKKYFAKFFSKKSGGKAPLVPAGAGPRLISSDSEISA